MLILISNLFRILVTLVGATGFVYAIYILYNSFKPRLVLFANESRRINAVRLWAIGYILLFIGLTYGYFTHKATPLTGGGWVIGLSEIIVAIAQVVYLRFQFGTMKKEKERE